MPSSSPHQLLLRTTAGVVAGMPATSYRATCSCGWAAAAASTIVDVGHRAYREHVDGDGETEPDPADAAGESAHTWVNELIESLTAPRASQLVS
jgi:hypothetical protein